MDPVLLIVLIVVGVLVVGGATALFMRGRSDHLPTLDPSTTDAVDQASIGGEVETLDAPALETLDDVDEPLVEVEGPEPMPMVLPTEPR